MNHNQPNFVVIYGETQGANVIGAYGHDGLQTPNTDCLAQDGTLFTRGYTTCPLCSPARAAMFTGIYSHTAGAWTNHLSLGDNIITMGPRFQDAGYHTAYAGRWHLDGHDYFGTGQCPDGWDDRYWYDGKRYLNDLTEEEIYLWREGLNSLESLAAHGITAEFTWGHRIVYKAIDFLHERDESKPFLLVVAPDEPHHPFTCPPEFVQRFQGFRYPLGPATSDSLKGKPAHHREWAGTIDRQAPGGFFSRPIYFGCNSFTDYEYGRLVSAVQQLAPENTYIILTTDHDDLLGAHQLWGKGPAMYEEITHVPFIIQQPNVKGAGAVNPTPASQVDILPTMLDLAGLEIPPILEGASLVPFLDGAVDPQREIVIEFNRYEIEHDSWGGFQPIRCLVTGQKKLVINLLSSDEPYDLESDPAEVVNLIGHPVYAQVRDEMHARLLDWMDTKRDPFRGPAWERRERSNSRRQKWMGQFRPRPADGYAPIVRHCDTGMPAWRDQVPNED
jgi:uncharacterized sulfatase